MSEPSEEFIGPHQDQPILYAGEPLEEASAAMIMIHGRGASAEDILGLTAELKQPGFAYLAPQAADHSWYPNSFLTPIAGNEPGLSSGLALIASLLARLTQHHLPPERTIILGFSQGACLSLEFVARNARRYGGAVGLSGGLIGPDETPRNYAGSLADTPVFLGCSDVDPHIPKERVLLTSEVLHQMGGNVTTRLYPRLGHTINRDELASVQKMMVTLISSHT
jgi:phospholipase/carboxylesterase